MFRTIGSLLGTTTGTVTNTGLLAQTAEVDTWNANTTTNSFNTTINGVAGRAAVAFGGAFYAYIHDVAGDDQWRMVIIFATRAIADEWWRAVSTSENALLAGNITRITPQFYTHDTRKWNVYRFFTESRINKVADPFRGKMFLVLENDRGGRGITVIPMQSIVDHASGDWFSVRSKVNADHHWYYDPTLRQITVSDTQRSSFKFSATNMHDGAIMIGVDTVFLVVQGHGFAVILVTRSGFSALGVTTRESDAFKFKFDELDKGRFVYDIGQLPAPLYYVSGGIAAGGWELAL